MASRFPPQQFRGGKSRSRFQGDIKAALTKFEVLIRDKILISGAAAGAKVIYDEAKLRVPVDTGRLRDSIYRFFDKNSSTPWNKIYLIGPNKRKAPYWYNVEYGHYRYNRFGEGRWLRSKSSKHARVQNPPGSEPGDAHDLPGALSVPQWVPARPYMRPAYMSSIRKAYEASRARMSERMREELAKNARD
jgi:hypothetical protein